MLKVSFEEGLPESYITKEYVDAQGVGWKAEVQSYLHKHLRITNKHSLGHILEYNDGIINLPRWM